MAKPRLAQIDPEAATDGQVVAFNAATGEYEPTTPTGADQAQVFVRRSTVFTLGTAFADIPFDQTQIENDPSVVEHNNTNTDDIDLKDGGTYLVGYHATVLGPPVHPTNLQIQTRVRANDTGAEVEGSLATASVFFDVSVEGGNHDDTLSAIFPYDATAADKLTLQGKFLRIDTGTEIPDIEIGLTMFVIRTSGPKGDKGDKGDTGTGVVVQTDSARITTDVNTTSATYVDISPSLEVTITTGANPVIISLTMSMSATGANRIAGAQILVDGTPEAGANEELRTSGVSSSLGIRVKTAALTAASHTFKVQWKTSGGTLRVNGATAAADEHGSLLVEEVTG
jgi:hypothetical protein